MIVFLVAVLAAASCINAQIPTEQPAFAEHAWSKYRPINLYRDAGLFTFFPYTLEQRNVLVSNAENVFKASCHFHHNLIS
ncbi:hypothetical protein O5D80_007941 [Batrachochytrium dendrobatidis]|nr:hypothetical protein O5D80_007941 [Batrachochytrium dendrobatidis]